MFVRIFVHMFVRMFVRDLLRSLQTEWHQTWHEGRVRKAPKAIGFHGNLPVVMATKNVIFWVRLTLLMTSWMMSDDVTSPMTSW